MTKNILKPSLISSVILAAASLQPALAYEFDKPIEKAFKLGQDDAKYGQIKMDLRYRYELADVANNTNPAGNIDTAHANTLRLRLGYLTPEFHGLQAFAEYEGNLAMQRDYNAPKGNWGGGNPNREVVADPQDQELNQAWLSYKAFDTEFKGGRQRIIVDDSRFIGNVGWRQMEQTFDSAMITNKSFDNLTIKVGYIGQVKNIWSVDDLIEMPFLNVNYKYKDLASITAYSYLLADKQTAAKSTQTYGFAITGSPKLNKDVKLHYRAEYSYQGDYNNNTADFDLNRYNLMLGATAIGITAKVGIEELGGDGTNAFQTALGTNHKFQGWADMFLTTPGNGVRDVNMSLAGKLLGAKLVFAYHNFKSSINSINYGNEYDFLVAKKFGKHYSILAKYAYYDAQNFKTDTNKFWLQGNVSF